MSFFRIDGVVPIIPTPFQNDETIDSAAFAPLVDFAVAGRCSAICLPAYASEFYKLSDEERLEVVRHAVTAGKRFVPVLRYDSFGHSNSVADSGLQSGRSHREPAVCGRPASDSPSLPLYQAGRAPDGGKS